MSRTLLQHQYTRIATSKRQCSEGEGGRTSPLLEMAAEVKLPRVGGEVGDGGHGRSWSSPVGAITAALQEHAAHHPAVSRVTAIEEGGEDHARFQPQGRPPPSPLSISTDGCHPRSYARNIPPVVEEIEGFKVARRSELQPALLQGWSCPAGQEPGARGSDSPTESTSARARLPPESRGRPGREPCKPLSMQTLLGPPWHSGSPELGLPQPESLHGVEAARIRRRRQRRRRPRLSLSNEELPSLQET
jgi:hypothetical protein